MSPCPKKPLEPKSAPGPQPLPHKSLHQAERNLQISLLPRTTAVTLTRSQVSQSNLPTLNPLLVTPQDLQGLVLGPPNLGLLPAARPPAIAMLDEQMGGSDLPILGGAGGGRVGGGAVVEGHVGLYLVRVGTGRGFPAGFLGGGVEVVGQVLGVGVSDFPLGGEPGIGGGGL